MRYTFSEKIFGNHFYDNFLEEITPLIQVGTSFTVIGIPNVGMDTFFRYLAMKNWAHFVYLDVPALKNKSKDDFFLSLYKEFGGDDYIPAANAHDACKKTLHN